ncbi:MAG TPA: cytochrome c oxidase subunit 3 [Edaphocola sp.]|nr:cytochrome c oxidase subunit 3 [Edaphocola sp.]
MSLTTQKSISNPPGGLLIWIVIYLELLTYGIALVGLAYYAATNRTEFHNDSLLLNRTIGGINTVLLLSSGFLIAKGVQFFKQNALQKTKQYFALAMLLGLGFLILKGYEYFEKIDSGISMDHSSFYIFYWLLTGFHWIHVLVGVVILFFIRRSIVIKEDKVNIMDIEAGAAFWHMCDLIWLFLFPILYLIL